MRVQVSASGWTQGSTGAAQFQLAVVTPVLLWQQAVESPGPEDVGGFAVAGGKMGCALGEDPVWFRLESGGPHSVEVSPISSADALLLSGGE
ncbi:MAG: hypothetical protein JXK05_04100 [Campylobacterales bacterium]|nr:hypothetical protein [Campylobacterales bacterium]